MGVRIIFAETNKGYKSKGLAVKNTAGPLNVCLLGNVILKVPIFGKFIKIEKQDCAKPKQSYYINQTVYKIKLVYRRMNKLNEEKMIFYVKITKNEDATWK